MSAIVAILNTVNQEILVALNFGSLGNEKKPEDEHSLWQRETFAFFTKTGNRKWAPIFPGLQWENQPIFTLKQVINWEKFYKDKINIGDREAFRVNCKKLLFFRKIISEKM